MKKRDLKAALLVSALGSAACVAPVMAEEVSQDVPVATEQNSQDEVNVNDKTSSTTNEVYNGWGEDGFYYQGGQKVTNEFVTIEGKTYFFDDNGALFRDGILDLGDDLYYMDVDGVMQTNFAYNMQYFGDDGRACRNEWVEFDGKWRYFGDDTEYYVNDAYLIDGEYHFFNRDGYAKSGWDTYYDDVHYFTEKGVICTKQWVDNNTYYVDENGEKVTNDWIDYSTYVGPDGKRTVNTWVMKNGKYRYKLGDEETYAEEVMVLIDGKYYAFDEDGYLVVNDVAYVDGPSGSVAVHGGNDGVLLKGWYTDEIENQTYYFGDNYIAYEDGMYTIDGKQYYFNWSGVMNVSEIFEYEDQMYTADKNGVVTLLCGSNESKWFEKNGEWYYAKNGVVLKDVLENINGTYYGFDENGRMVHSDTFFFEGRRYYAYSNGVVEMYKRNTWFRTEDGRYVYYDEYGLAYGEWLEIDGKKYHFDAEGYLKTGLFSIIGTYGTDYYIADASGAVDFTPGWRQYLLQWYYAKEDGTLYMGWKGHWLEENGKKYYFYDNGTLAFNTTCYIDGVLCYFDTNGVLQDSVENFEGVIDFHGKTYLNKNGNLYYDGEYEGYYYNSGVRINNGWIEIDDQRYEIRNGKLQKGWIEFTKGYYEYADPKTGALVEGWQKIDGKWYYFNTNLMQTGYIHTDEGVYLFGKDGAMVKKIEAGTWYQYPNTQMWLCAGVEIKNEKFMIDGVTYYVTSHGKKNSNAYYGVAQNCSWYDSINGINYWVNSAGTGFDTVTGWKKTNLGDYGYVENGRLVTGYKVIDGIAYYFDDDGYLIEGIVNCMGKAIVIDANGKAVDYKEGWNQFKDEFYYIRDGMAVIRGVVDDCYLNWDGLTTTGVTNLDDDDAGYKWLLIHGKLAKNQWYEEDGYMYYADENGHITSSQQGTEPELPKGSWQSVGGQWKYIEENGSFAENKFKTIEQKTYYFDANGYMVTGWQKINGQDYYFNTSGIMSTNAWVGAYYLGEDGAMFTNAFTPDGYYVGSNGTYLTNTWFKHNGKDYYVNGSGLVVKNTWSGVYYLGEDGAMLTNAFTPDGYYVGETGAYLTNQKITVSGKDYYLNSNGQVAKNQWVGDCYIDGNGNVATNIWVGSYYVGSDGKYVKNQFTPDGYYCGADGVYVTNRWIKVDGKDYYMNAYGKMTKDAWVGSYYLGSDGVMATSSWVDNNQYYVNENGVYVAGRWVQYGSRWCYYAENVYAKNITLNIGGTAYTFDSEGYMVE